MSRQFRHVSYLVFLVLLVESLAAVSTDTPGLPNQDRIMRLVSFPCDVTLEELRASEGKGLVIYKWNGTDYEEAASLERGLGYFISASASVTPDNDVCSGRDAKGLVEIQLKQGWNLFGLPVNRAMSVRDVLGPLADDPDTRVFTLHGAAFSLLTPADRLEPRKGYWVYAPVKTIIAPDVFIKKLRITGKNLSNIGKPQGCNGPWIEIFHDNAMPIGDNAAFSAKIIEGKRENNADGVTWSVDRPDIATIDSRGVLTAKAAGTVEVRAAAAGVSDAVMKVNVIDMSAPVCLSLGPAQGAWVFTENSTELSLQAVYFSPGSTCESGSRICNVRSVDVFKEATFMVTPPQAGAVANKKFTAGNTPGYAAIEASYKGLKSNGIKLIVSSIKWSDVRISNLTNAYNPYSCGGGISLPRLAAGSEMKLKAVGYFNDGKSYASKTKDVTEFAVWSVSDASAAEISGGVVKGLRAGKVSVTATIGGVTSPPYKFEVRGNDDLLCLTLDGPPYVSTIEPGNTLQLNVAAVVFPTSELCKSQAGGAAANISGSGLCKVDITKSISRWNLSDPAAGAIDADGIFRASDKESATDIIASYGEVSSNRYPLYVRLKQWYRVSLSITGGALAFPPPACGLSNEILLATGETLKFQAIGYYSIPRSDFSGGRMDVTEQAVWIGSDENIAEIKSGALTGKHRGTVMVTASFGGMTSAACRVIVFDKENPIYVTLAPSNGIKIPPNGSSKLTATAYYASSSNTCKTGGNSNYGGFCQADVTKDVSSWELTQPSAGAIDSAGTFKAGDKETSTQLAAVYEGLKSNSIMVNVKKVNWMLLWASTNAPVLPQCPLSGHYSGCYAAKPGETYQLSAKAQEDSYMWTNPQDVTAMAKWEVSDSTIAEISSGGALKAKKQGLVWIRAYVGDARSDKIWLAVGEKSGFEFVLLGTTGDYGGYKPIKPLQVGSSYPVTAIYYKFSPSSVNSYCGNYYDDGWGYDDYSGSYSCSKDYVASDITSSADWKVSNDALGQVTTSSSSYYYYNSSARYFKGLAPGMADVTAEYKGLTSNALTIDVWNLQSMTYCDANNVNMGEWKDDVSAATLETDCKVYNKGESVRIRYSAYVNTRMYLDNCLDLFILDDKNNIVRTLRNEGCTSESLDHSTMGRRSPDYQTIAAWDMKNDSGKAVPAGHYYAVARFYIVWEPVIRLPFTIR